LNKNPAGGVDASGEGSLVRRSDANQPQYEKGFAPHRPSIAYGFRRRELLYHIVSPRWNRLQTSAN
jgi:hypothetical protein